MKDKIRHSLDREDKIELINTLDFTNLIHLINSGVIAQRFPLDLTEIFNISMNGALANMLAEVVFHV